MRRDRRLARSLLAMGFTFVLAAGAPPHEVTHLGSVIAVGEGTLEVMVIDERSQSQSPMTFRITGETKVYRGESEIAYAAAEITTGERCAVTVNNDIPGNNALAVRLAAHHE